MYKVEDEKRREYLVNHYGNIIYRTIYFSLVLLILYFIVESNTSGLTKLCVMGFALSKRPITCKEKNWYRIIKEIKEIDNDASCT